MIKFSLKTISLILLSLFSITSFASAPWTEEASSPIAENDAQEATTQANRPAAMQDNNATKVTTDVKTSGDILSTPASGLHLLDFPRRGMSTDKVQNELGRPADIIPAVGTPPITRWIYNDRVVFFEGSSVIHVVAK